MQHDAWFFVGIFAFIFLVWIATGGPTHPLSFSGPTLAQPGALGGGTYLSLPTSGISIGTSHTVLPDSSYDDSSSVGSGGTGLPSYSGVSFGTPSPYRGVVSMGHYISGAGATNPSNESVIISVSSTAGVPVDLTGWTLESEATGNASVIPQGTSVPTSGIVNSVQDIVLTPGQRAIVISGRSPIGASFRENKCIGYFANFQNFSPSLPQNCPTPQNELMTYSGSTYIRDAACIDYVNTLSRCQAVLTPPTTLSGTCQSFLVTDLNYNGCISAHRSDTDFNGDTWRIFLGRTNALWRTTHEVVKLLDASGKTVDAFSY